MENRSNEWCSDLFHVRFREVLIHASARYDLACPIYILMPDHWHLVWMGLSGWADQHTATKFLRRNVASHLGTARLQDRPHDHLLRAEERKRNAFMTACYYVASNAARANLVSDWKNRRYLGAIVPGYPVFDPRTEDFWADFWKIYNRLVDLPACPGSPKPGYNPAPGG